MKALKRMFTSRAETRSAEPSSKKGKKDETKKGFFGRKIRSKVSSKASSAAQSAPPVLRRSERIALTTRNVRDVSSSSTTGIRLPRATTSSPQASQRRQHSYDHSQTRIRPEDRAPGQERMPTQERMLTRASTTAMTTSIPPTDLSPSTILNESWNSSLHKWDLKTVVFLSGSDKFSSVLAEARNRSAENGHSAHTTAQNFYIPTNKGYFVPTSDMNMEHLKDSMLEAMKNPTEATQPHLLTAYEKASFIESKAKHSSQGAPKYSIPQFYIPAEKPSL